MLKGIICRGILFTFFLTPVLGDIYEWEWIDPGDPSLGKQQSGILCPDGAGIVLAPEDGLFHLDLNKAWLRSRDLESIDIYDTSLADADMMYFHLIGSECNGSNFSNADLSFSEIRQSLFISCNFNGANFRGATISRSGLGGNLTNADFTDATIDMCSFTPSSYLTKEQLYSTASYQNGMLRHMSYSGINLQGWDFSYQNVMFSNYRNCKLTDTVFTGAIVRGANFESAISRGFTSAQFYSTASYQNRDLQNINLSENDLTGWDFSNQNLSHACLEDAVLTGANFTNTTIRGASFSGVTNKGFTAQQFYSTADYAHGKLRNMDLSGNQFIGWDFSGRNLENTSFKYNTMDQASLVNANICGAVFDDADIVGTTFNTVNTSVHHYKPASFGGASFTDVQFRNANLNGSGFGGCIFDNVDFQGSNLNNSDFNRATIISANFADAMIEGANFQNVDGLTADMIYSTNSYQSGNLKNMNFWLNDLTGFDFSGIDLSGSLFIYATMTNTNLENAVISNTSFNSVAGKTGLTAEHIYSTASYKTGEMTDIDFGDCDLTGWDLSSQNLTGMSFYRANLTNTDISNSIIQGVNFFDTTDRGFDPSVIYTTQSYLAGNLTDVNFGQCNLTGMDFSGKNLSGSNFQDAVLESVNFTNANLSNTELEADSLTNADFTGAIINGAYINRFSQEQLYSTHSYQVNDLSEVGFGNMYLVGADLSNQNLTNASFYGTYLLGTDLSDSIIKGVRFKRNFSKEQLYSTQSYKEGDLQGVEFPSTIVGWDLSSQNLSHAIFPQDLTDVNFTDAVIAYANFDDTYLSKEQLYSTLSYKNGDLSGIRLLRHDLVGWIFEGVDLREANFERARMFNINLTNSLIQNADFSWATLSGFTKEQLYSTKSYKDHDLHGVNFSDNEIIAWDFRGQNLRGADFSGCSIYYSDFTDADMTLANISFPELLVLNDFTRADLRGVHTYNMNLQSLMSTNTILPDGRIECLNLLADEVLTIRDFSTDYYGNPSEMPVFVEDGMSLASKAKLRMVFEDTDWGSTMVFEEGIDVTLGGTLELMLDFNKMWDMSMIGTVYDIFDWEGVCPMGQFNVVYPQDGVCFDVSNLMTTGEVTLTAIPEPCSIVLLVCGGLMLRRRGRRNPAI